MKIVISAYVD